LPAHEDRCIDRHIAQPGSVTTPGCARRNRYNFNRRIERPVTT
jgi:hypothetical protein